MKSHPLIHLFQSELYDDVGGGEGGRGHCFECCLYHHGADALPIELWEASILPRNLATNKTQLYLVT